MISLETLIAALAFTAQVSYNGPQKVSKTIVIQSDNNNLTAIGLKTLIYSKIVSENAKENAKFTVKNQTISCGQGQQPLDNPTKILNNCLQNSGPGPIQLEVKLTDEYNMQSSGFGE